MDASGLEELPPFGFCEASPNALRLRGRSVVHILKTRAMELSDYLNSSMPKVYDTLVPSQMIFDPAKLTTRQPAYTDGSIRSKDWVEQDIRKQILLSQPKYSILNRHLMTANNLTDVQIYQPLLSGLKAQNEDAFMFAWFYKTHKIGPSRDHDREPLLYTSHSIPVLPATVIRPFLPFVRSDLVSLSFPSNTRFMLSSVSALLLGEIGFFFLDLDILGFGSDRL